MKLLNSEEYTLTDLNRDSDLLMSDYRLSGITLFFVIHFLRNGDFMRSLEHDRTCGEYSDGLKNVRVLCTTPQLIITTRLIDL